MGSIVPSSRDIREVGDGGENHDNVGDCSSQGNGGPSDLDSIILDELKAV